MVGRLLAKLGVASSTITEVVYLDTVPANSFRAKSKEKTKEITEELKTIEDVELFERVYGCNFVFVNSWDNRLLYSARTFYEQNQKNEEWKNAILKILNAVESGKKSAKNYCKDQKGVITLFDDQNAKTFRMGEPEGGKW